MSVWYNGSILLEGDQMEVSLQGITDIAVMMLPEKIQVRE